MFYLCVLQSNAAAASQPNVVDISSHVVVYRLYMSFVSSMLNTLRNGFVSDAISFVGVHQQRIHQVPFTLPAVLCDKHTATRECSQLCCI